MQGNLLILVLLVGFSLLILGLLILITRPNREKGIGQMLGAVLDKHEKAFLQTLQDVVRDDALVLVKIRAGELAVAAPQSSGWNWWQRPQAKRLGKIRFDFLICHPQTLTLMAVFNLEPVEKGWKATRRQRLAEELCRESGIAYYEMPRASRYSPFALRAQLYGIDNTIIDSLPAETRI